MIVSPDGALEKALATALKNINGVFGDNVSVNRGSAKDGETYCVFFWAGGGERQLVMRQDMNDFVYSVKCVSPSYANAVLGQAQILDALRRKGEEQVSSGVLPLDGSDDWCISTVYADRVVTGVSAYGGTKLNYERGNQFRIHMEAR